MDVELRVVADAGEAARAAAEELARAAAQGGHLALSGGSSPRAAYELAATLETDWSGVDLWWADDRCVAPGDARSNYRLVRETLLDGLSRPPVVHRVHGERSPDEAADAYDAEIRGVRLDLALLGVGADGHTASLFPGSPALDEAGRAAVAAEAGLEPFVPRVTLTIPFLSAARLVLFLVTGSDKAEVAERAFDAVADKAFHWRQPAPRSTPSSARGAALGPRWWPDLIR